MLKRRYLPWLLIAAALMFVPTRTGRILAQGALCGQFTDVPSTSVYCSFILEAYYTGITQGTSATTFSPSATLPREQAVTFLSRTMDNTLHRGTVRTAIGKTWSPTSIASGTAADVAAAVNDIVSDGIYLWVARNDGKILKMGSTDRRVLEIWSIPSGIPRKLGFFAGVLWIADNQGGLSQLNPAATVGTASLVTNGTGITGDFPALAFDGTNIWWAGSGGNNKLSTLPIGGTNGLTFSPGAGISGLVFDGTSMWVLMNDSHLLKMSTPSAGAPVPSIVETLTLPAATGDCRMVFDGDNIWITSPVTGTLYVVRPSLSLGSPSTIVKNEAIPDVAAPYVASFDGEYVMIGGTNNGNVALYRATTLQRVRTFATGASAIRGIASDGRNFTLGDASNSGSKIIQF